MTRYPFHPRPTAFVLAIAACFQAAVTACTIFVLTEPGKALFFNNEDWSNPQTRMWFVPEGEGHFGCVYVGFDDGFAQGGMNTEGLAFDWVAGFEEKWERDPELKDVRGNSSQRMIETCRTVQEAEAFYRTHWEAEFSRARILVADRSGASVVMGARAGKFHVVKMNECRGFGYAGATVRERLLEKPPVSVASGMDILKACRQKGQYATKYSNAFDLRTGDIHMVGPDWAAAATINLHEELKKGGHYFEIPKLREQLGGLLRPLPPKMRRFPMASLKETTDDQPEITAQFTRMLREARDGKMRQEDYTPALWTEVSSNQEQLQADLKMFGELRGVKLVERWGNRDERTHRYRVVFEKADVLQTFTLNPDGKVIGSESEWVEWK